jgi:hypothetical protein
MRHVSVYTANDSFFFLAHACLFLYFFYIMYIPFAGVLLSNDDLFKFHWNWPFLTCDAKYLLNSFDSK